jgi:hypothetical protein
MKKVAEWLHSYGILILIFFVLIGSLQTCATRRQNEKLVKEVQVINKKVDSLTTLVTPKDELAILLEINRLNTAKMILYDWNTVVRTVVRPDDRMNEYDNQIAKLQKDLQQLRANKSKNGK